MVIGSGVGVKAAVKRKQENTATRHGRKIVLPEIMPNKFKATRKSGNINARPKIKISLRTKSKYSSNRTRLSKLSGVNPNRMLTAFGRIKYAKVDPVRKSGVAIRAKNKAVRFSLRCKAGVMKAQT